MDLPETSSQRPSGEPAARRSPAASAAGDIVDLGGVPVLLRSTGRDEAALVASLLPRLPAAEGPAAVTLTVTAEAPGRPDGDPTRALDDVEVWPNAFRHRSGMTAMIAGPDATLGGGAGDRAYAFRRLFQLVLARLLGPLERFVLHAGALVDGDGRSLLVLGDTGAGKSTLAAAALGLGWSVVSDDLVVARGEEVCGVPRPITVPAEVVGFAGEELADDPRRRRRLSVDLLRSGWHRPAAILAVGHSAGDGDLRPLAGHHALPRLVGAFLAADDPELLRRWFPSAGHLSRLPAWELLHAAPPDQRLAAAQRLLAVVPGRSRPWS